METGIDFLRAQVDNAIVQHDAFLRALVDHETQAQDVRFRDLCGRHVPHMREHQRLLERFRASLGDAKNGDVIESVGDALKKAAGTAIGIARELADAPRQSDFLRLVGDIVMGRQGEDTFKTFREAGRTLGISALAELGEIGERHHDEYVKDANRLVQQIFVEHARGAEHAVTGTTSSHPGTSAI